VEGYDEVCPELEGIGEGATDACQPKKGPATRSANYMETEDLHLVKALRRCHSMLCLTMIKPARNISKELRIFSIVRCRPHPTAH
jgi:hypothetical protein